MFFNSFAILKIDKYIFFLYSISFAKDRTSLQVLEFINFWVVCCYYLGKLVGVYCRSCHVYIQTFLDLDFFVLESKQICLQWKAKSMKSLDVTIESLNIKSNTLGETLNFIYTYDWCRYFLFNNKENGESHWLSVDSIFVF